jgi:FKBP-type peptidyl-prolyl cis-trans isomerase
LRRELDLDGCGQVATVTRSQITPVRAAEPFSGERRAALKNTNEMKAALIVLLGFGAALTLSAAEESQFKSTREKASYALGMNMGKQLRQNNADIDLDVYTKALKEALSGGKLLLTDEEVRETLMSWQMELRNKTQEKNKKDGEDFLVANKTKEGVQVLPITVGTNTYELQYKIETKGTGKIPTTNDTVNAHYRGTLITGDEFDSSYKRGEPSSFPVTGVIKGWTEALLRMPVGSKWKLFIPSELAYGERGRPGIPPNATLLFDIELVSIKDPAEASAVSKPVQLQPKAVPAPPANQPK